MLAANKNQLHGTVKLLFQMAEEIGTESRHYVEKAALTMWTLFLGSMYGL